VKLTSTQEVLVHPLSAISQARNASASIAALAPRGYRDPCWDA